MIGEQHIGDDAELTAEGFVRWLELVLTGDDRTRTHAARPTVTTQARELVNGELRPTLAVFFERGGYVVTVSKIGPKADASSSGEVSA